MVWLAEALPGWLLAGIASFALWCRSRWPGRGPAVTVGALFAACCQASLAGRTPSIWAIA